MGKFCDEIRRQGNQGLASLISLSQIAGMKYGYARVSTDDQTPVLQLAALKRAACKLTPSPSSANNILLSSVYHFVK